jgi:hypothetical protein
MLESRSRPPLTLLSRETLGRPNRVPTGVRHPASGPALRVLVVSGHTGENQPGPFRFFGGLTPTHLSNRRLSRFPTQLTSRYFLR